ncbi:MAG: hypothetical protein JWM80_1574 [Cyanobacteria bacterium RYN_339]|nr:hypothetical protein [Cyanobacteria bacterium RYN_339]
MRRTLTTLLAAVMLSGCAHSASVPAAPVPGANATAAAKGGDAATHAKAFAAQMTSQFTGTVQVKGSVVTLSAKDQATVTYDFKDTPRTGQVAVSTEGFSTTVSEKKLLEVAAGSAQHDKVLPALVVAIAVHVAIGGAKALAIYWLTHRENFNKQDAIRATVVGMGTALVAFLPYGQYMEWLVPIAVDILMQVKLGDFKEIAAIAMKQVDKIVEVIKRILHAQETGQAAPIPAAAI